MIVNIQRYSTHDGPGIRTVVFLKGCSLTCLWCQNPESCRAEYDVMYDPRLCISGCRLCRDARPEVVFCDDDRLTIARGQLKPADYAALARVCPSKALTVCGEMLSVDEIMQRIAKDAIYYQRSDGGITLSGGEPFMQPKLTCALLEACKQRGYHTAVETCLHVPFRAIAPSLPYSDLLLADLKHTDPAIFKRWTKGSAKRILQNFRDLSRVDQPIIIRVPLIPGFNADHSSVRQIIDFAADETCAREIHFLPYHTLGMNKYALLDQPYLAPPDPLDDDPLLDFALLYAQEKKLQARLRG